MKLHRFVIGLVPCVSLVLSAQAQNTLTTLDWKFSTGTNPSLPSSPGTTNQTGGAATATLLQGNNTYFFGTGPEGIYGTPTGLWAMEYSGTTAPEMELKLDQTPLSTVDLTLVLTHFVDNSHFTGTVQLSLPNWQYAGRQTVVEQTGNMIGYWVADTYLWNAVSFMDPQGKYGLPITLDLFPGAGNGGLLLDEVKLSILGAVSTVPEPMCGQLAGLGLLLFGIRAWLRRRTDA